MPRPPEPLSWFFPRPLTFRERIRLLPPVVEAWSALKLVGLRDRLRCPNCRAVGTWKPHGTLWDRWRCNDRCTYRWMCKWCGYYNGPEGTVTAWPDPDAGCWTLPHPETGERGLTPDELLHRSEVQAWPWFG